MVSSWDTRLKMGRMGERLVKDHFKSMGYCIYPAPEESAPIDFIAIKEKEMVFVEVKTKPRRLYHPDTGIDVKRLKEYKGISLKHNTRCFLAFVDIIEGSAYGNYIDVLEKREITDRKTGKKYPSVEKEIIYFKVPESFLILFDLSPKSIKELASLNTASNRYRSKMESRAMTHKLETFMPALQLEEE